MHNSFGLNHLRRYGPVCDESLPYPWKVLTIVGAMSLKGMIATTMTIEAALFARPQPHRKSLVQAQADASFRQGQNLRSPLPSHPAGLAQHHPRKRQCLVQNLSQLGTANLILL